MANEKDLNKDAIQGEVAKKETSKKVKNLTVTELKKINKKLDTQTEHPITVRINEGIDEETGEAVFSDALYKVKVDNVFRKTKQHKLLEDLISFLNEGNDREELLEVATPYITLLLIKHFSSLEVPNDIDEAIEVMNILVDLGAFSNVVDLMPEDQLLDMYETISASVDRMNANIDEMLADAKELSNKVENGEVKELLESGE